MSVTAIVDRLTEARHRAARGDVGPSFRHDLVAAVRELVAAVGDVTAGERSEVLARATAFEEQLAAAAEDELPIDALIDRLDVLLASLGRALESNEDGVDGQLLELFTSGCTTTLADLEARLLEGGGGGAAAETAPERVDAIRRAVHTLKGECGVLSLEAAQRVLHDAETAIDRATESCRSIPVDALLAVVDWLRAWVQQLVLVGADGIAQPPDDPTPLTAWLLHGAEPESASGLPTLVVVADLVDAIPDFVAEARGHLTTAEQALLVVEERVDRDALDGVMRAFHTIKGVASFLGLAPIVDVAHGAENLVTHWRDGRGDGARHAADVDLVIEAVDRLRDLIDVLDANRSRAMDGVALPFAAELETLIRSLTAAATTPLDGAPAGAAERASTVVLPTSASSRRRGDVDVAIKVDTRRLDALVDMVGELGIALSMVVQDDALAATRDGELQRNLARVVKITTDLQESSMALRMVAIKGAFQKMVRLARDVSRRTGKLVDVVVDGAETELDRKVVEEVADPLVHMIRNAIDHGIETPQERIAAGKPERGRIDLRAYHRGGAVIVEVEDDGRGLDRDRILARALEEGVVDAASAAACSDHQAYQLVFGAGFTTRDGVTDLSGRGVGMDVVRRNIEDLRGDVDIESRPGCGTRVRLQLPLTLAIIDGMIVRVGDQRLVIPTLSIERTFRPEADQLHDVVGSYATVATRDGLLRLQSLAARFDLESDLERAADGVILVVESAGSRTALLVDDIVGQQQVVIKTLGLHGRRVPGIAGGAILGDGCIALILDVVELLASTAREVSCT